MVRTIEVNLTPAQARRRRWAQNLSALVKARGWTPKQFHAALVAGGGEVTQTAVYSWLAGDVSPKPENQALIARVTGTPAHITFPVDAS